MSKDKEKKTRKVKRNKHRRYSYINAIDELLEKYFVVYTKLTEHSEGCISAEIYDKMNDLLVEDYNASINNLEFLSKQSMKYLKKKDKKENSKIFWYKFRRFFRFKKNEEIEKLIKKKEKFKLEFALLFEDIISSKIRSLTELEEIPENNIDEEEMEYVDNPDELFSGPSENRALYPEIVENEELGYNEKHREIGFKEEDK